MDKIVIGLDQSYTRTGLTILVNKKIKRMQSINFEGCENNTDKRKCLYSVLDGILKKLVNANKNNVIVITEKIRLRSQGFISEDYIKSTGALVATIIDVCRLYNVPVFSVDTRSWKSQIVGSSKPLENQYGINPEKYRTILYMRDNGLLKYIVEEYKGRGKKGVLNVKIQGQKVPCKINDDMADSYCIAFYGFLPKSKQKLKEEKF